MIRSIASSKSFISTAVLSLARGEQRRLVDEVGEVRSGETGGARGDDLEVHAAADLHRLDVDPQDVFAPADVRLVHQHLAVEAAGAEQGRVEHFGAVGRPHDDDALAGVEAVHLGQQLVERLLALLVAAHRRSGSRTLPSASSSSMKTMHGALASAWANRSRTRDAPTPTNISTNSEPLRLKNGTLASPATARASSVLPVPGGPTSSTPFGIRPPMLVYFFGVLRNSTISFSSSFGLVDAGDVIEAHLDVVVGVDLGLAARERHDAPFRAAHPAEEERPERDEEQDRDDPAKHLAHPAAGDLAAVGDAVPLQLLDQLRILDADGVEGRGRPALSGFNSAANRFRARR